MKFTVHKPIYLTKKDANKRQKYLTGTEIRWTALQTFMPIQSTIRQYEAITPDWQPFAPGAFISAHTSLVRWINWNGESY
jgi:hypothetical protein